MASSAPRPVRQIHERNVPGAALDTGAGRALRPPLEGFLYSLKDAHIFIETQELFRRRRFPSWAPTSVYRKDSMQIFLN